MRTTRFFLSLGTMGALLLPTASLAAVDTDVSASADASITSSMPNPDFLQTFINSVDTDNGFNAVFDARAFANHPCFSAVGAEMDYCLRMFGVTSDFESMIEGDMLGRLIIEHALDRRCADLSANDYADCQRNNDALLPDLLLQLNLSGAVLSDTDDDEPVVDDEPVTEEDSRRARMERLWELCEGHDLSQAGCYQSFLGAINRATVSEIEALFDQDTDDRNDDENNASQDADVDSDANTDVDVDVDADADSTVNVDQNADDEDDDDVRSETFDDEAAPMTRQERAEWLWDLCADASDSQAMCYRSHYRTAINEDTDLAELESDLRS